jgi:hypothetical protein
MKSLKIDFESKLTLEKFMEAHKRASKGKGQRAEVLKFNMSEMSNLCQILDVVANGTYSPSKYRQFWITDPKERLILALPYMDRVIHQWFIEEFIKPYYVPRFIYDNYACIPGKGTHKAAERAGYFLRKAMAEFEAPYVVKCDIAKFFNNIDKNILYEILCRRVPKGRLRDLIHSMIFDNDEAKGIPIGNYISQYFANIYLNELDQYVKRQLKLRYYLRYMDDFVCFVDGKVAAREVLRQASWFVSEKLNLRLNQKSRISPAHMGLDFCGYRIFRDYRLLRKRSKQKIKEIIRDYEGGVDDYDRFYARVHSWMGHVHHADSWRYAHKVLWRYNSSERKVVKVRS